MYVLFCLFFCCCVVSLCVWSREQEMLYSLYREALVEGPWAYKWKACSVIHYYSSRYTTTTCDFGSSNLGHTLGPTPIAIAKLWWFHQHPLTWYSSLALAVQYVRQCVTVSVMVDYHIPSILLRQAAGTAVCHDCMLCFVVTTASKIFYNYNSDSFGYCVLRFAPLFLQHYPSNVKLIW